MSRHFWHDIGCLEHLVCWHTVLYSKWHNLSSLGPYSHRPSTLRSWLEAWMLGWCNAAGFQVASRRNENNQTKWHFSGNVKPIQPHNLITQYLILALNNFLTNITVWLWYTVMLARMWLNANVRGWLMEANLLSNLWFYLGIWSNVPPDQAIHVYSFIQEAVKW